jgi:hypothetical protein
MVAREIRRKSKSQWDHPTGMVIVAEAWEAIGIDVRKMASSLVLL